MIENQSFTVKIKVKYFYLNESNIFHWSTLFYVKFNEDSKNVLIISVAVILSKLQHFHFPYRKNESTRKMYTEKMNQHGK